MTNTLRCDQFDELLPDYLEETLAPDARRTADTHVRSCVRCTGLLDDLAGIRAEAASLPVLTPSRDLWSGIAARIEAPVVEIGSRPQVNAPARHIHRAWLAAAAVALMMLSSGTTWLMTRSVPSAAPAVVATRANLPAMAQDDPAPGVAPSLPPEGANMPDGAVRSQPSPTKAVFKNVTRRNRPANAPSLERTYEREVVALRRILTERAESLDPSTVAVLEASLKMIDQAILQSRQALAADPASGFLRSQLNKALDHKVEVLRTAAMLPART